MILSTEYIHSNAFCFHNRPVDAEGTRALKFNKDEVGKHQSKKKFNDFETVKELVEKY